MQKHPTGKEYSSLLAGKEKFPIFLDANKRILSMPPIINSQEVGKLTEKTKEVFIECSGFDLNVLNKCLNIIVTSLAGLDCLEVILSFSQWSSSELLVGNRLSSCGLISVQCNVL